MKSTDFYIDDQFIRRRDKKLFAIKRLAGSEVEIGTPPARTAGPRVCLESTDSEQVWLPTVREISSQFDRA